MLDLNNIAADRYHKGPLRKQFSPLVIASEDRDTPITNNHGDTNNSSQWIDTIAWWRPVERGGNVTITIYVTIVTQTINETFNIHIILASPQTSFGVRSSRIHFSPTEEKWMRDERIPKDVCGEANIIHDEQHLKWL